MIARGLLPTWFWLVLSLASCSASLLAWNEQRAEGVRRAALPVETASPVELPSDSSRRAAVLPIDPVSEPAAPPVVAEPAPLPVPAQPTRVQPQEPPGVTKVLRCTVRGRVTYIDPSSACPDGSNGKITVLPR